MGYNIANNISRLLEYFLISHFAAVIQGRIYIAE